jgi:Cd(II)/Pb(II)-responsive transcriptional regulator
MRIGDLATATGTPVETIRYYEREGLIPLPRRADNNYRLYTPLHAQRLAFIRHCRHLDMTLDEVRALLRLKDRTPADCSELHAVLDAHIGHVAERIRELRDLQSVLETLRARCDGSARVDACGLLDALAGGDSASRSRQVPRHVHGPHR